MKTINELALNIKNYIDKGYPLVYLRYILLEYTGDDWKNHITYNKDKYTRNIVYQDDKIEIIIICWYNYQKSGIHDHPDGGCLMRLLEGNLVEETYKKENNEVILFESRNVYKNTCLYKEGKNGLHRIMNELDKPACTIHIYSPPQYKAKFYEL